ncbi:hypothetical protein QDR37_06035 [Amnibacterium sp. CER49]|uniref:hypothetical protein n=1 Tax=Amnibacterium sp. CER49 TaxID=3039161 RepID=UPI0024499158|nr:hypothetical protein [Amnibacterium sp. CER49]MDH2443499.1 hypothetical protein [Amnibacterium sp. CER49]
MRTKRGTTGGSRPRVVRAVTVAAALVALQVAVATPAHADTTKPRGHTAHAIAGYAGDQLANAEAIVGAATALHLGRDAAVLGVAAAMGESGLRNLPYGDGAINPDGTIADSIGLFQQQHWWGSRTNRMTPSLAATAFFTHLRQVRDWRAMTPTAAIHAVQGNRDPHFYTPFYLPALLVVDGLALHPVKPATSAKPASGKAVVVPVVDLADAPGGKADPAGAAGWTPVDVSGDISSGFLDGLTAAGGTLPSSGR